MSLNKSQRFAKTAVNLAAAQKIRQGKISLDELERLAQCLSNYDGEIVDFSGVSPEVAAFLSAYDGSGDDLTDMEGGSFHTEQQDALIERVYSFTVTNGNNTDQTFFLTPGFDGQSYSPLIGGGTGANMPFIAPGVLVQDGANYSTTQQPLTVVGEPKPFQWFFNFVQKNPTRVVGFKITSTVATQIQTAVHFERQSPFRDLQTSILQLSNYQNEHTYQDKTVTVPIAFQMDDQQRIRMTIRANSTMTITLFCGAVANLGKFLEKRAIRAKGTVRTMPKSYNSLGIKDTVLTGMVARPLLPA